MPPVQTIVARAAAIPRWAICVRANAQRDIGFAVAVRVANGHCRITAGARFPHMELKLARRGLFKPNQRRWRRDSLPAQLVIRIGRSQSTGDDVQVSVAIQVQRFGSVTSWDLSQRVRVEFQLPHILQSNHAVIRLKPGVIHHVAVGQQHVEITVAVEVYKLKAGKPPKRMWCAKQLLMARKEIRFGIVRP